MYFQQFLISSLYDILFHLVLKIPSSYWIASAYHLENITEHLRTSFSNYHQCLAM